MYARGACVRVQRCWNKTFSITLTSNFLIGYGVSQVPKLDSIGIVEPTIKVLSII